MKTKWIEHLTISIKTSNVYSAGSKQDKLPLEPHPTKHSGIYKNVNAEMYASNAEHNKQCILCGTYSKSLHVHHMTVHPKLEFFLSRISPEMMKVAVAGTQEVTTSAGTYIATCLFCEKQCIYSRRTWLEHMADHMASYLYQCQDQGCQEKCNRNTSHKLHCSGEIKQFRDVKMKGGDDRFYAYACRQCHYVQFERKQITKHLKNEHNFKDEKHFVENTQEIVLFNPVLKSNISKRRYSSVTIERSSAEGDSDSEPEAKRMVYQKNDKAELHATNAQYKKKCDLCGKKYAHLVNHIVKWHPNNEVYLSRPSPDVLKKIQSVPNGAKIQSEISNQMIELRINKLPRTQTPCFQPKFFCIFCDEYRRCDKGACLDHISTHTGEYQYFCRNCNKKSSYRCHCGFDAEKIEHFNWEDDYIYGFMCKLCQFVQLREDRVIEHVHKQHHIDTQLVFQNYCKTNLMVFEGLPIELGQAAVCAAEEVVAAPQIAHEENTAVIDDFHSLAHSETSCVSTDMFWRVMGNGEPLPPTYLDTLSRKSMGFCVFCEDYVAGDKTKWVVHLCRHMNEHLYKCDECNEMVFSKRSHTNLADCPNQNLRQLITIRSLKGNIQGFICTHTTDPHDLEKMCKFVQLEKKHMLDHLKAHHADKKISNPFMPIDLFNFNCETSPTPRNHFNQLKSGQLTTAALQLANNNLPLASTGNSKYIAHCLFCQELKRSISRNNLIMHTLKHTNEAMFKCSACGFESKTNDFNCCGSINLTQLFAYENNRLNGFVCKVENCYFVQLSEENMERHVQHYHPGSILKNSYGPIRLIDFGRPLRSAASAIELSE